MRRIALAVFVATLLIAPAFAQTTKSNLDQASGWQGCGQSCAGGGSTSTFSMTRGVSSPSKDGASAKFYINPNGSYADAIWWNRLGTYSSYKNFTLDYYYYMTNPAASQAIEMAITQGYNDNRWFKFSTQCSFAGGVWRFYSPTSKSWVSTSVPCSRLSAYTWHHVVLQYQVASGMSKFLSLTLDGHTYYFNNSLAPQAKNANSISTHFQLDGNKAGTSYAVWVDKYTVKMW